MKKTYENKHLSKKEKSTFIGHDFLIVITLPIKLINNRRINTLAKGFKGTPISFVYSKNATKNIFFHIYIDTTKKGHKKKIVDANIYLRESYILPYLRTIYHKQLKTK